MKKHIPNLITLLNLLAGTIAVILAVEGYLVQAFYFVLLGIVFDFFDGFAARLLSVQGELGKQLDSLADMVTSGVVPGIVMFQLLKTATEGSRDMYTSLSVSIFQEGNYLPLLGLLITLGACYRLAKFNIDTRQTSSFVGVPTPANAIFILSLPLIINYSDIDFVVQAIENKWFLIGITLLSSYMMNAEIPLFSLKFKDFTIKNNWIKYVFIIVTIILLFAFEVIAIPLVIVLYVLLSVIENKLIKNK